jgi:hypothetical protein
MATYQLGPEQGRILVSTGRAGLAARAGHDLTIEITRWSARVEVPGDDVASATITPSGSGGTIDGTLTMRGTTHPVRLEITSPGAGRYLGSTTIRQTDFGITPYSGFFGALKLRDEVAADFEVTMEP